MGPITSFVEWAVDCCRSQVKPVPGSIVYCDYFLGYAEHSGIYIGKGKIVHLTGDGRIEATDAKGFLFNKTGLNIYVSSNGTSPVGNEEAAKRAKDRIGSRCDYNFIMDNCHQFTSGCLSGDFGNSDNFLWMLKHTAKNYGVDNWRFWNDYYFDRAFD